MLQSRSTTTNSLARSTFARRRCVSPELESVLLGPHNEPLANEQAFAWVNAALRARGNKWDQRHAITGGYTSPAPGTVVQNSVMLQGQATSHLPIHHVNMTANYDGSWKVIQRFEGAAANGPYTFTWDLTGIADQQIQLGFDVVDQSGAVRYSPVRSLDDREG